jgi:hypothetical protein
VKLGIPTTKELSFRYQEGRNELPLNSPQELSSGAEINLGKSGKTSLTRCFVKNGAFAPFR